MLANLPLSQALLKPTVENFPGLRHAVDGYSTIEFVSGSTWKFYDRVGDLVYQNSIGVTPTLTPGNGSAPPYIAFSNNTTLIRNAGSTFNPGTDKTVLMLLLGGLNNGNVGFGDYGTSGQGWGMALNGSAAFITYTATDYLQQPTLGGVITTDGVMGMYFDQVNGTGRAARQVPGGTFLGVNYSVGGGDVSAKDWNDIDDITQFVARQVFRGFYLLTFDTAIDNSFFDAAITWMGNNPGWIYPGFSHFA